MNARCSICRWASRRMASARRALNGMICGRRQRPHPHDPGGAGRRIAACGCAAAMHCLADNYAANAKSASEIPAKAQAISQRLDARIQGPRVRSARRHGRGTRHAAFGGTGDPDRGSFGAARGRRCRAVRAAARTRHARASGCWPARPCWCCCAWAGVLGAGRWSRRYIGAQARNGQRRLRAHGQGQVRQRARRPAAATSWASY